MNPSNNDYWVVVHTHRYDPPYLTRLAGPNHAHSLATLVVFSTFSTVIPVSLSTAQLAARSAANSPAEGGASAVESDTGMTVQKVEKTTSVASREPG